MSGGKKRKVDTEGRQFQEKWTEEFFFILHNGKPICLLCNESISVMKEFNRKRHYSTKHATLHSLTGQLRTDKIQKLTANLEKQQQMFHKQRTQLDNVVKASFIVSSKLAKALKPFAEGEFIKECMLEVCSILCPEKKNEFEKISLSRRTVVRRIEMMANDIKTTLTDRMAGFESFSIALDESTDLSDTAQLAIFIRGVDKEFTVTEELLALQPLKGTTTGEDIFIEVQKVFTSFGLPWSKLIGVCTDGAPSMVGLRKGFIGILNEKATELNVQKDDLIVLHCIIHQQNLCSKSIRLQNVMNVVVKTINFIRSRGLNHRQFKAFLDEISAEYNDVTYYCEVRWLSKGKMLKRFYELRNEIADFMKIKDKPLSELSDPKWICDLAFLVDLTGYLNDLNLKLQKQGQLVNDLYSHLKAFQIKLRLWESQMLSGNSYHFNTLSAYENIAYAQYAEELKLLSEQFSNRFSDFKNMEDCFSLFATPTKCNVQNAPIHLQMELIEIQENSILKSKLEDVELCDFYKKYLEEDNFPQLRKFARRLICAFGSTYKCEQFFSLMKVNKSTHRTRLTDDNLENSLRLCISGINPNIDGLVSQIQAQVSH